MGQIVSLQEIQVKEIQRKQSRRWQDITRDIPTPLTDQVLALGPNAVPDHLKWKRLLRVAAWLDTHLQRSGSAHDLPATHTAYLDNFQELVKEYRHS